MLIDHYSLEDLKKKGHDIPSLIKLYEKIFPKSRVLENITFLEEFNKIYKTRYIQLDGSHKISQMYSPTKDKRSKIIDGRTQKEIDPDLEWSLEEIDQVIYNICTNIKLESASIFEIINSFAEDSPEFYKDNNFFTKNS